MRGEIWGIHAVAHRATAIECRAMIATLQVLFSADKITQCKNVARLKWILKCVWKGKVRWTGPTQRELDFWLSVDFSSLAAPMSFGALANDLQICISNANQALAPWVKVFAVDTSDTASGGGEFIRQGHLWSIMVDTGVHVSLLPAQVLLSSCYRELLGVLALGFKSIPRACTRAIVVCDSQAAVHCLLFGSRVLMLQTRVSRVFPSAGFYSWCGSSEWNELSRFTTTNRGG